MNPSDAYPPGSLSGQIDGSAVNTAYGGNAPPTGRNSDTPGSLPIDPYLKCSTTSAYSTGWSERNVAPTHRRPKRPIAIATVRVRRNGRVGPVVMSLREPQLGGMGWRHSTTGH